MRRCNHCQEEFPLLASPPYLVVHQYDAEFPHRPAPGTPPDMDFCTGCLYPRTLAVAARHNQQLCGYCERGATRPQETP
jgi:hypothetical protein